MKGQSEIVIFILLFIIGIFLFITAVLWSRTIFQQNVDIAKITNAENLLKEINNGILNSIKFGGVQNINYNFDGTIELKDYNTIELKTAVSIELPDHWVNITSDSFYIREKLEGNTFRAQLIYPEKDYRVELFTEGPKIAQPNMVRIEKNSSSTNGLTIIKIKITFI